MAPFMILICELFQVPFLSFVVNFYFCNNYLPVTTLGQDLFLRAHRIYVF